MKILKIINRHKKYMPPLFFILWRHQWRHCRLGRDVIGGQGSYGDVAGYLSQGQAAFCCQLSLLYMGPSVLAMFERPFRGVKGLLAMSQRSFCGVKGVFRNVPTVLLWCKSGTRNVWIDMKGVLKMSERYFSGVKEVLEISKRHFNSVKFATSNVRTVLQRCKRGTCNFERTFRKAYSECLDDF